MKSWSRNEDENQRPFFRSRTGREGKSAEDGLEAVTLYFGRVKSDWQYFQR